LLHYKIEKKKREKKLEINKVPSKPVLFFTCFVSNFFKKKEKLVEFTLEKKKRKFQAFPNFFVEKWRNYAKNKNIAPGRNLQHRSMSNTIGGVTDEMIDYLV